MVTRVPHEVGGYILAGGRSSRMGEDKALLRLAGKPLIRHAVKKLRRSCMDVRILSGDVRLEEYAPLVPDIHPGCGPMSGMEAGLIHSVFDWNLFLAVDMPFLPSAFIWSWLQHWLHSAERGQDGAWVRMFTVDGYPQPGFCLVHKKVSPYLTASLEQGQYKLVPVLKAAAMDLAVQNGMTAERGFWNSPMNGFYSQHDPAPGSEHGKMQFERWVYTTEAQQKAQHLWFANVNTPEEFSEAERHVQALDT